MSTQRKRLLELIDILKLPITADEAENKISQLSEEDVERLVSSYEEVLKYQDEITSAVIQADPETGDKILNDYNQGLNDADSAYLQESEKLQEAADKSLDDTQNQIATQAAQLSSNFDLDTNNLTKAHDDLYSKINNIDSRDVSNQAQN